MGICRWSVLFVWFLILGCETQEPDVIFQTVNETIQQEARIDEYEEWNHSEYHPEKVFDDWLEWGADSTIMCNELSKLSALDLTVFENQIRDVKYRSLVDRCQKALVKKLDDYWKKEKESFPVGKVDFKLNVETLEMDSIARQKIIVQGIGTKRVLLTFDDGPHPEYTEKLLKLFKLTEVKALFFLLGKSIQTFPAIVSRLASEGHSLGTHTDSHFCIAQNKRCRNYNNFSVSKSRSQNEIATGAQKLIGILGWTHPFFRFPYGESSPDLQEYIYGKGFFDFYWSIDSEDWKKRGLGEYYQSLVNKIESGNGGNILFHDIHKRTLEVMVPFLRYLHKNNYTIVIVKAKPVTSF